MNTPILLAIFGCFFVAAYSIPVSPPFIPSPEVQKCSDDHHITPLKGDQLAKHRVQAENDDEKCFLSCYLKERGYLVNGKMDFNKMIEAHKRYVPEQGWKAMEDKFRECEKNLVYEGKTVCEIAYAAYTCAK
uniref:Secreted Odorant Binding Protein Family protein n=1 Tax=Pristhesancus plagipennis TaxID=1955184 RepID=A0A2K8JM84_PRIPG|nr:secreted Odorant Binding Protein Family protein [Pristhesancus plagipennis]